MSRNVILNQSNFTDMTTISKDEFDKTMAQLQKLGIVNSPGPQLWELTKKFMDTRFAEAVKLMRAEQEPKGKLTEDLADEVGARLLREATIVTIVNFADAVPEKELVMMAGVIEAMQDQCERSTILPKGAFDKLTQEEFDSIKTIDDVDRLLKK